MGDADAEADAERGLSKSSSATSPLDLPGLRDICKCCGRRSSRMLSNNKSCELPPPHPAKFPEENLVKLGRPLLLEWSLVFSSVDFRLAVDGGGVFRCNSGGVVLYKKEEDSMVGSVEEHE